MPVEEWVRVYHGSINDAADIRAWGLNNVVRTPEQAVLFSRYMIR